MTVACHGWRLYLALLLLANSATAASPAPSFLAKLLEAYQKKTPQDALAVEQLNKKDSCSIHTSCSRCAKEHGCHWCGGEITGSNNGETSSLFSMGACRSESTLCETVKFGNLNKELNVDYSIVAAKFEVREIAENDPKCSAAMTPAEFTAETCDACTSMNPDYGWCTFDVQLLFSPLTAPSLCLRKDLQFLCDKSIIPRDLPSLFALLKIDVRLAKAGQCGQKHIIPQPTIPSTVCSENLSCDTCGRSTAVDGCTWCGGKLTMPIPLFPEPIIANALGVCIPGTQSSCASVKFGELPEVINTGSDTKFEVVKMSKSDDQTSQFCTSVEWPVESVLQCNECVSRMDAGWCELANRKGDAHGRGGVCAKNSLSFFCSMNNKNIQSTWLPSSCPSSLLHTK